MDFGIAVMKILFFLSLIIPLTLGYLVWGLKTHNTNITLGPFTFDLQINQDDSSMIKVVDYINSPDNSDQFNNWALEELQKQYFIENSSKSLIDKVHSYIFHLRNGEPKTIYIRRLYAQLFAKKTGQISAAEIEIKDNLNVKDNYKDYIFLGQIMSYKKPVDNEAILSNFQKAIDFPSIKKDKINYKVALSNIHLRKGHIHVNNEKYEDAIDEYVDVIKINKYSFTAYSELGTCFWKTGDINKAIDNYDKAIMYSNSDGHTITVLFNKSNMIFQNIKSLKDKKQGDNEFNSRLKKALLCIDLAIKKTKEAFGDYPVESPQINEHSLMLYLRANIYKELGIVEKSNIDLENFLKLSSDKRMRNHVENMLKGSNKAN